MREIKAHTGLRGIASMAVFLGHGEFDKLFQGTAWVGALYSFFYWQNPAVDLFFMLSGFVLNYVYLKERKLDWRNYFSARFARICPLYYAGLFAVLAMNYASARLGHDPSPNLQKGVMLRNLFLVQEWPFFGVSPSIVIPSWSISVEAFLYIAVFPLFVFLLRLGRPPFVINMMLIGIALAIDAAVTLQAQYQYHLPYAGLIRGIAGFCTGFLVCDLVYGREKPLVFWPFEALIAVAAVALLPFHGLHFLLMFFFAALLAVTYPVASPLGRLLGTPVLAYIGALSYSIYIWHLPVLKATSLLFHVRDMGVVAQHAYIPFGQKVIYCAGSILLVAIVSNTSYYWFENPLRRLFRHSKRPPLPQPPPLHH